MLEILNWPSLLGGLFEPQTLKNRLSFLKALEYDTAI